MLELVLRQVNNLLGLIIASEQYRLGLIKETDYSTYLQEQVDHYKIIEEALDALKDSKEKS